jgi:uncharacterized protein (TIGR03905 family)
MTAHSYRTRGVCASSINFETDEGKVKNVRFNGGCNGNLKAISKLVDGMEVDRVIEILEGNTCGNRSTSCADQFARALKETQA